MDAGICFAGLVHTLGRALSSQVTIQSRMSFSKATTLVCDPRLIFFVVNSPNHRSTMLRHGPDVGVKCNTKEGWRRSQRSISSVLCVAELSQTRCTERSAGTSPSINSRNFLNSSARCRRGAESRSPCRSPCPTPRTGLSCHASRSRGRGARRCRASSAGSADTGSTPGSAASRRHRSPLDFLEIARVQGADSSGMCWSAT
ncbi:MAG: hypothetical protein QOG97_2500 [Acidimicrobiaceae bacterium]|nr:hypothetical protein [Acidimicrobiaceae bacterium]